MLTVCRTKPQATSAPRDLRRGAVGLLSISVAASAMIFVTSRSNALPFAVRCTRCEEAREEAERREQALSRRQASSLYLDVSN